MKLLMLLLPCLVLSHPQPDSSEEIISSRSEFGEVEPSFFDRFDWGYVITPSNGHVQRKEPGGGISGNVAFINANGNPVQWSYVSHPSEGFKVTEYKESQPELQDSSNRHAAAVRHNALLKSAEGLGYLRAAGFDGSQVQFKVDDELIKSAGGESQLAYNLGAIPVAAVHDARAPPNRNAIKQTAPLLVPKQTDHGHKDYFLVVPSKK